jgi:hypothetical protein
MAVKPGHYRANDFDYTELLDVCKRGALKLGKQGMKDLKNLGVDDPEAARREIATFILGWLRKGDPVDQWLAGATQPGEHREGMAWERAACTINGKPVSLRVALGTRGWEVCAASG